MKATAATLIGSAVAAWHHWRQHCYRKHGNSAAAAVAASAACHHHGGGSDGRQFAGSATAAGMAAAAAATTVLPLRAAMAAMKTPAVTAMAGAHATINDQLKAATATEKWRQ